MLHYVIPDDHSRVKLELIEGEPNSDYINANYLDVRELVVFVLIASVVFIDNFAFHFHWLAIFPSPGLQDSKQLYCCTRCVSCG